MIQPGATLGLIGGGQLGRMFTQAAQRMGFEVQVLDPDADSPAGRIATRHLKAAYTDADALAELGQTSRAVTTEFENVPAESLMALRAWCLVRPGPEAVSLTQDRLIEKSFARAQGLETAAFASVTTEADCEPAFAVIGTPALLKTARLGYDGKGQADAETADDVRAALHRFGGQPCILERRVPLDLEISVVLARGADGAIVHFPVAENRHVNGILDTTVAPARIPEALAREAYAASARLATAMDYIGTMAVEFFVSEGRLLINELAPRPHNSGHFTLDACATDQFEQQVRALAGLPLGAATQHCPAAMVNLLGDLWRNEPPNWDRALTDPQVHLHLYGKSEPRPGRKMGHLTALAPTAESALSAALAARHRLGER